MAKITSQSDIAIARQALSLLDPALAAANKVTPPFEWWTKAKGFKGLVMLIVEQQVSMASAKAVFARLEAGVGTVTPLEIGARTVDELKTFGLSTPKAKYIHGVALAIASGEVKLEELEQLDDEAACQKLIELKGIGRWTAEAYLMGCEGRKDVFPAGDIALQEAVRILDRAPSRPTTEELYARAERWRPYRSLAANLLWGFYLAIKKNVIPMPQGVPPIVKASKMPPKKSEKSQAVKNIVGEKGRKQQRNMYSNSSAQSAVKTLPKKR